MIQVFEIIKNIIALRKLKTYNPNQDLSIQLELLFLLNFVFSKI